jgi:hypothetical protein
VAHPGAAEGITPLILGMSGIIVVGSAAVFVRTSQLGIVSEQVSNIHYTDIYHFWGGGGCGNPCPFFRGQKCAFGRKRLRIYCVLPDWQPGPLRY